MATSAQINANQINAQSSSGPKTPEGKAAASRNATTHGLHSVNPVLPHESQAGFDGLHERYRAEFEPGTEHENFLVRQMAEARWRLARLQRIEAELIDILANGRPRESPEAAIAASMLERGSGDALSRLHRLAGSAERAYHRCCRDLANGRRERRKAEERQWEADLDAYMNAPPPIPCTLPSVFVQNEPNRALTAAVPKPSEPSSSVTVTTAPGGGARDSR